MQTRPSSKTIIKKEDKKAEEKQITPKTFDDLKVVKILSVSTFQINLVHSESHNKQYALKIFPYKKDEIIPEYKREARFMLLNHPNIIGVHFCEPRHEGVFHGKKLNVSYVVMEYAPYGNFCELIQEKNVPYDEKLTRTYFDQLIDALEYIHTKGVAHLDLKLDNLLLGENFKLKLCDFERTLNDHQSLENVEGSTDYRAPEIIEGNCKNAKAADIYAAGIILFCMKYHRFPYLEGQDIRGYDMHKLLVEQNNYFWEAVDHIYGDMVKSDKHFRDLFISMTKPDPEQRATLYDIKKNEWFKGAIYSKYELELMMKHITDTSVKRKNTQV
jgi:serine/threonine protein kinase